MFTTLISGGQTGADRAALDWALSSSVTCGGWCPNGRRAEDGVIDESYPLKETESAGYLERTRLNVQESDGTLIVNLGELDGGSFATLKIAESLNKPVIVIQVDEGVTPQAVDTLMCWLKSHPILILNVAGPRESKRPGIYHLTFALLEALTIRIA